MKESRIAKEGLKLIIPTFVLSLILLFSRFSWVTSVLGLIVLFFCLFCVYFFRNPKRVRVTTPGELISPADGKVTEIRTMTETEFMGYECTRVTVFMSPADVHVNRAPCVGQIEQVMHKRGEFAMAFKRDVDQVNERNYILIKRGDEKILLCQIAGFLARRIIPYVKAGDAVQQGDPVGIIAFGSRVDIYFPQTYEPVVQLGQRVKAGLSLVARKKVP